MWTRQVGKAISTRSSEQSPCLKRCGTHCDCRGSNPLSEDSTRGLRHIIRSYAVTVHRPRARTASGACSPLTVHGQRNVPKEDGPNYDMNARCMRLVCSGVL